MWPSTRLPLRSSIRIDSGTGFLQRASTAPPSRSIRSRVTKILPLVPSKVTPFSVSSRIMQLDVVGELRLHLEGGRRVVAVVDRRPAVLVRDGQLGLDDLDRARARVVHAEAPLAMSTWWRTPVGELAAGVLVPPAELVVAALLDVVDLRRLAEPHVPVQVGRGLFLLERAAARAAADGGRHLPDLADPARADQRHGQEEDAVVVAPLLGADLDDPARRPARPGRSSSPRRSSGSAASRSRRPCRPSSRR